jgi:hypothetical protein
MNKILTNINRYLLILSSCLLIILLSLFLHMFYFEYFFFNIIHQDILIELFFDHLRDNSDISLNNAEDTIYSERSADSNRSSFTCSRSSCSCSSSCSFSEDKQILFKIKKYKEASKKTFNKLKDKINNKAKYAVHKIKVFDRALSWFFRGSRPGGGRGL